MSQEEKKEVWKAIEGYVGFYEVSNTGKVRSLRRNVKGNGVFTYKEPKLLRQSISRGYKYVSLCSRRRIKCCSIHRLVLNTFGPVRPSHVYEVGHLNGIRHDNRIENLAWVTKKQNSQHRRLHGTWMSGESNGRHLITEKNVLRMRDLHSKGVQVRYLINIFGVSRGLVEAIVYGRNWKHLLKAKPESSTGAME